MIASAPVPTSDAGIRAACAIRQTGPFHLTIVAAVFALLFASNIFAESTTTIEVNVRLRTGGSLDGLVVDHDSSGLVVVHERKPYAFAWSELEPGSVFAVRRDLLAFERGGRDRLTAEDHFALGAIALDVGRNDLAGLMFRQVRRLDPSMNTRIERAFADFRERQRREAAGPDPFDAGATNTNEGAGRAAQAQPIATGQMDEDESSETPSEQDPLLFELVPREGWGSPDGPELTPDAIRRRIEEVYRQFGDKVREVMGPDVTLIESDNFLVWTDFPPREHARLANWSEAMYAALVQQFALNSDVSVFPAKCPIFCWRHKGRFRKFARWFDGYDARDSIGYTRSLEASGHTHVVLQRWGDSPVDADHFACTLVHEGTHAFVHRLYTTRLIPHWVNEGLAELAADRVLRDRCPAATKARLLARVYVRYDWPIGDMLHYAGPIDVELYPLAHSVVAYLDERGRSELAAFIRNLKAGQGLPTALSGAYDGLTMEQLEADWRKWVRNNDPQPQASAE